MKRKLFFGILCAALLMLFGCGNHVSDYEAEYSFPEPTIQIKITKISQGGKAVFVIGPETYDMENQDVLPIINWFYGLDLEKCEKPEDVDGNQYYDFVVDNKEAFGYDDRGGEEAFIIIGNQWYKVKNPSVPPIE